MDSSENQEITKVFHQYLTHYAARNKAQLFSLFGDKLTGFGTGPDEVAFTSPKFKALYERDFQQVSDPLQFTISDEYVNQYAPNVFIGMAIMAIRAELEKENLTLNNIRLSIVFVKEAHEWKLVHMHISHPLMIQKEGETIPIEELQKKNAELEQVIQDRTQALAETNQKLTERNQELENALKEVQTLKRLLPICSNCKKIRNDTGYWESVEEYFVNNTNIQLSHGLCNDCMKDLFPNIAKHITEKKSKKSP